MPRYAAFLRAVNLGAHRKASSQALRNCFEDMGFSDVATFRTSGNVVFGAPREPVAKLTSRVEEGLARSLGFEVVVFLRTAAEVRAIAAHEPFPRGLVERLAGKLQLMMLSTKPSSRVREEVLAHATGEDALAFGDRELYWLPSGGTQESQLDLKAIDRLLGATTMRTKGTVEQLVAKHFAA
jgi:uncharacterized protein (DUF1697 family)